MKPIMQSIFTPDGAPGVTHVDGRPGDCYRACIASVFEMELEDVPHFVEIGEHLGDDDGSGTHHWWHVTREWLRRVFNLDICNIGVESWPQVRADVLQSDWRWALAAGKSPRDTNHIVVWDAVADELAHDPSPHGGGIVKPEFFEVFCQPYPWCCEVVEAEGVPA